MNLNAPGTILNYIDGEFCAPSAGNYTDNINPATGKVYSRIPSSNSGDVNVASEAAQKAFESWRLATPEAI